MALTTGIKVRGYVVVSDDEGTEQIPAWVLLRDGTWMALTSAQAGHKPLTSTVRVCRTFPEAARWARRHTLVVGLKVIKRPRVLSAHAAGITEVRS